MCEQCRGSGLPGSSDSRFTHFDLTLMLLFECNLNCSYCYEHHRNTGCIPEHTVLINTEKAVHSIHPGGVLRVGFLGGEPLLHAEYILDLIPKITALCSRHDIETGYVPGYLIYVSHLLGG